MSLTDSIIGRPLATSEERAEHIGVAAGIPIFGLDGLTSAAYGPEAAMTLLIPLGIGGVEYGWRIIGAILILLAIVYFSYRQTIAAYPGGGGSYTVASENLGEKPGLLAAAALMIDYILTAAVGISAGVTALTSSVQGTRFAGLQSHTLLICLIILVILALVNMRGVKDTGTAFMLPTFLFVSTLLALIVVGMWKTIHAGGHPMPMAPIPAALPASVGTLGMWMLLKAFASGCAAMTGVEAVSNGVMAFGEPRVQRAQRTLTVIIGILMVLLFGIAYLAKTYRVMPMDPDAAHFQSLLSLLVTAVFGRGWFYFLTMGSVLVALALSANTAFADFPRLTRAIALHDYLPHVFILRGRRLLYSHGIYALTGFTALILILFGGVTDRLIPLYAIGAFLAFTLSQAGMVVHWKKGEAHPGRGWHMFVNGIGAVATGITTLVVLVAKFRAGAWVTALLVPVLIGIMWVVKRHYARVKREMADLAPLNLVNLQEPLVVIPMARWDRITEKAMRFGLLLSKEIKVVHIHSDDEECSLEDIWEELVMTPIKREGLQEPQLVTIPSNYRFIISPLMDYILKLEEENPGRKVAVLLPELVVRHWWENALHNQRVQLLKLLLLVRGNQRIVVVNIPWYL
ncbi:APC family permease [Tunturiibacter gelidoferens]|jgi:amino acid transporter|uniref:Amino acid transporter n=1 Tax=Tunturiibacter gelidiferens TaxID=3069689 RepID=A0A9X0QEA8_9BACT|nr:APC family permease [Edaphobacter lichenicola]MBB5328693.1 amino acid transporter [Edaphobacter lichenicola]